MVRIIMSGLIDNVLTSLPAAVVYLDYTGAVPLRGRYLHRYYYHIATYSH